LCFVRPTVTRKLSVSLSFSCAASLGFEASIAGAVTLAIGIGIQNFRKELPYWLLCEEWE
jgi:hypothetical protein